MADESVTGGEWTWVVGWEYEWVVGDDEWMVVMKLWMSSMRDGGQLTNENELGKQMAEKIN